MDIVKMLTVMKKREIYPSVYAVVINYGNRGFVTITVAFTEMEARGQAVELFFVNNPDVDRAHLEHPMQFMLSFLTAEQVARELTDLKFEEESPKEKKIVKTKSDLLAEIITSKDMDLYEKNKKKFTKNERDFILDRLK